MTIAKSEWIWFGHAGHLIVAQWCRFHLCTLIGDIMVSTVGEYVPEEAVREILHDYMRKEGKGYNHAGHAARGHYELCEKWAAVSPEVSA